MVERVYLLLEIITILIGLHVLHRGNKRPGIAVMIYLALALIVASAIEAGWIHGAFVCLIYLGLVMVCKLEYGDGIFDAVIYIALDIALLGALQMIGGVIVCGILRANNVVGVIYLLIILCSCGLLLLSNRFFKWNRYIEIVFLNGNFGKIILLAAALAGIAAVNFLKRENFIEWKDLIGLPLLIIVISIILFQWQKERYQNMQKAQELLAYEKYNLVYKDLINRVRRRQHDFNNHINAVFSMNTVATNLKELVKWQDDYCKKILAENNTNRLLRDDVSSVLAGFIFTKIEQAESKGIEVKYKLEVDGVEEHISFIDFVEVFGNLFDNAMEEVADKEIRIIDFTVTQDEHMLLLNISNPCEREKAEKIQSMFLEGISSKGKDRGFGLANVDRIVAKYEGRMQSFYADKEGTGYIIFNIVFCY